MKQAESVHSDLQEAIEFHKAIVLEGSKALVGYETAKALANVVLLSEIPTTYDKREQRQVNAGNLLLRGVPGVGKTFFGVILAAISDAKFARIQGRADLQPTEIVGFQMINPATGELITEFGPLASAEVILLDEINRIPLKSQSAFLEGLQDPTVTVRSCNPSRNALCDFSGMRLISSRRMTSAVASGPNSVINWPVAGLIIWKPTTSVGCRSARPWSRANFASLIAARITPKKVFPTPGTPRSSRLPALTWRCWFLS